MVKKINFSVRVLMILVVIFSFLGHLVFKWNLKMTPKPLFAIANLAIVYFVTYAPDIFKRFNLAFSDGLYLLVLFAVMVGFVLGMGFRFYQVFRHYDTIIHTFNGGVIAVVGFAMIRANFDDWQDHLLLIAIGAVMVSVTVGAIWEIYEFVADLITDGNMQRYKNIFVDPVVEFVGQKALFDTMIDIIVDTVGAIIASVMMYMSATKTGKICNAFTITYTPDKKDNINNDDKKDL